VVCFRHRVPFKPGVGKDDEDEYFQPFHERMWDAEDAVTACAVTTVAGFLAKARFLGTIPVPDEDYLLSLGEDAVRLAGDVS